MTDTTVPGTSARTRRATVSCLPRLTERSLRGPGSELSAGRSDLAALAPADGHGRRAGRQPFDEAADRLFVGTLPRQTGNGIVGNEIDFRGQRARPRRESERVLARIVHAGEQRVLERDAAAGRF